MRIDDSNRSTRILISQMKAGDVFFWDNRYWMVLEANSHINVLDEEDEAGKHYPVVDLKSGIVCMFVDDTVQPLPSATLSV
jgi:hypothetical protein